MYTRRTKTNNIGSGAGQRLCAVVPPRACLSQCVRYTWCAPRFRATSNLPPSLPRQRVSRYRYWLCKCGVNEPAFPPLGRPPKLGNSPPHRIKRNALKSRMCLFQSFDEHEALHAQNDAPTHPHVGALTAMQYLHLLSCQEAALLKGVPTTV